MPIAPLVNGGVAPQVRRPRLTINEGVAVSGPFDLTLYSTEAGTYRPAPNNITVLSDRVAITSSPNPVTLDGLWGEDFAVGVDVLHSGTHVGYLWIKSVDANSNGFDDLETGGSVSLDEVFALFGSTVELNEGAIFGVGNIGFSGSGQMTNINPLSGVGELVLSGEGTFGVVGAPEPLTGVGNISFTGSGVMANINPLLGVGNIGFVGAGVFGVLNPLGQVTNLQGTAGDASVVLTWNQVTNRQFFTVQRATDTGFTQNLVTLVTNVNALTYTNNAVNGNAPANGTPYYYRVKATASGYTDGAWGEMTVPVTPAGTPEHSPMTVWVEPPSISLPVGTLRKTSRTITGDSLFVMGTSVPWSLELSRTPVQRATMGTSSGSATSVALSGLTSPLSIGDTLRFGSGATRVLTSAGTLNGGNQTVGWSGAINTTAGLTVVALRPIATLASGTITTEESDGTGRTQTLTPTVAAVPTAQSGDYLALFFEFYIQIIPLTAGVIYGSTLAIGLTYDTAYDAESNEIWYSSWKSIAIGNLKAAV